MSAGAVVLSGETVSLVPAGDVTTDVERFEASADPPADGSATSAETAIDRYRGDLLPEDLYEQWSEGPRERLRLRYLEDSCAERVGGSS